MKVDFSSLLKTCTAAACFGHILKYRRILEKFYIPNLWRTSGSITLSIGVPSSSALYQSYNRFILKLWSELKQYLGRNCLMHLLAGYIDPRVVYKSCRGDDELQLCQLELSLEVFGFWVMDRNVQVKNSGQIRYALMKVEFRPTYIRNIQKLCIPKL